MLGIPNFWNYNIIYLFLYRLNKIINNTIHEYLNENLSNEIKQLQRELNYLENVELERARKKRNFDLFDEIVNKIKKIKIWLR